MSLSLDPDLCRDGAGERRKISGNVEMNEADKDYNRHIAG